MRSLFMILIITCPILAVELEFQDRVLVLKFQEGDFLNGDFPTEKVSGVIEAAVGWRLGCEIKTPVFHVPKVSDVEIQAIFTLSGMWDAFISDTTRVANWGLAEIDIVYFDELGFRHQKSRFLNPRDLGVTNWFFQSNKGTHYYGGSHDTRQVTFGPLMIPADSKNVTFEICQIAPQTSLNFKIIEVRLFQISS